MKIIHISTSLLNGGLENMMIDIANEQVVQGHKVVIIILNQGIDLNIVNRISPNIKTFFINRKKASKNPFKILKFILILYSHKHFNIIHSHSSAVGKVINVFSKIPSVLTIHAMNYDTKALKYFDKIFAISNSVIQDIEARSKFRPILVYNGINTSMVHSKDKCNKPTNNIKIVQVSGLNHFLKGQDILIKAITILKEKKFAFEISLDIVGDGVSSEFLRNLVNELSLTETVNFLGNKQREWVYSNLCDYDLFIQPSREEGFGLTIAEAMAAKVPIISSNIDGPAEILNNGKYGYLFKSEDALDLANTINIVFAQIASRNIERMVDNAYLYCKSNFDIRKTSNNYVHHYQKIVDGLSIK